MSIYVGLWSVVCLGLLCAAVGVSLGQRANNTDGVSFGLGATAFVLILCAAIGLAVFKATEISCRNTASSMELPYRWSGSTGCLVFYQGRWWPSDSVRVVKGIP